MNSEPMSPNHTLQRTGLRLSLSFESLGVIRMSDSRARSSAQHLLGIYQTRLSMAERGVTSPRPDVVTGMRRLVAGLSALDPNAEIALEIHGHETRFIAAATGELLGEFTFTNDA